MGTSRRIYVIDENDNIRKIPEKTFNDLHVHGSGVCFPWSKGQKLRHAIVTVYFENRKPIKVVNATFGCVQLDDEGFMDEEFLTKQDQLYNKLCSIQDRYSDDPDVIDVDEKITKQRYREEFHWTPSRELLGRILAKTLL